MSKTQDDVRRVNDADRFRLHEEIARRAGVVMAREPAQVIQHVDQNVDQNATQDSTFTPN